MSSFNQNWHPRATGQAPYSSFRIPMPYGDEAFGTGNMGPNLPRGGGNLDTSVGGGTVGYPSDLPYIGAHLPIAPGDPHWTPPPSLSGPHNRVGDPARPGYDSPVIPMDFPLFRHDAQLCSAELAMTLARFSEFSLANQASFPASFGGVAALDFLASPTAVGGLVVPVIVDAIQRRFGGRSPMSARKL